MSTVRKLVCCLVLLSTLCLFAGCNTWHGAGKDIENAGESMQKQPLGYECRVTAIAGVIQGRTPTCGISSSKIRFDAEQAINQQSIVKQMFMSKGDRSCCTGQLYF